MSSQWWLNPYGPGFQLPWRATSLLKRTWALLLAMVEALAVVACQWLSAEPVAEGTRSGRSMIDSRYAPCLQKALLNVSAVVQRDV